MTTKDYISSHQLADILTSLPDCKIRIPENGYLSQGRWVYLSSVHFDAVREGGGAITLTGEIFGDQMV